MEIVLTESEIRVLASLVEKEITTPEYYPLTLNALVNACNQKSNRDPVVSYNECTVTEAVRLLNDKGLVIAGAGRNDRVLKYKNYFANEFGLKKAEVAVMCELMLRGPQTVGELRTRAERMHPLSELSEVEAVLEGLAAREDGPLVVKLPRQPGRKESRYAHLLSGEIDVESIQGESPVTAESGTCAEIERITQLEEEVFSLRAELDELKEQFTAFREQFE